MVYQKISCHRGFARMAALKIFLFFFWIALFAPATASAAVVEGLFEVDMPILDESKAIRRAALDDGLVEVLIRVSGDSKILEKLKAPSSVNYVQQFGYSTQDEDSGSSVTSQRLWVRYNETKVMNFLRQQTIPIWGERRNQAVIWLAVRDGGQRYILKDGDVSQIKSKVDEALHRRGIPASWPKNDALDQQAVRFADIWAGFAEPLKQASKRYSSGPVISGNMGWDGRVWKGEWSLFIGDEIKKWRLSGHDYATLIARATDLTADIMGQKYAMLETLDGAQHQQITVEINQVNSVEAFRRIEKYLASLSAVKSIKLSQVESDRVFFDLTLRTKVDDLLNLIQSGKTIALLVDDAGDEGIASGSPVNVNQADLQTTVEPAAASSELIEAAYRFVLR